MKLNGGRRLAALAGLAVFVLGALGAALYPSPEPEFTDKPATITAFYQDNADGILATRAIYLITGIALLFFVGLLRSVLARAEGRDGWLATTAFGGGLVGIAMLVISNAVESGAVLRVQEQGTIDPPAATAAYDVSAIMFGLAAPTAFAVLLLATAAVAWRTGVLPRWHAVGSIVLGITLALPPISYLTMIGFPLWVGVTAIVLVVVPVPDAQARHSPPAAAAV